MGYIVIYIQFDKITKEVMQTCSKEMDVPMGWANIACVTPKLKTIQTFDGDGEWADTHDYMPDNLNDLKSMLLENEDLIFENQSTKFTWQGDHFDTRGQKLAMIVALWTGAKFSLIENAAWDASLITTDGAVVTFDAPAFVAMGDALTVEVKSESTARIIKQAAIHAATSVDDAYTASGVLN